MASNFDNSPVESLANDNSQAISTAVCDQELSEVETGMLFFLKVDTFQFFDFF